MAKNSQVTVRDPALWKIDAICRYLDPEIFFPTQLYQPGRGPRADSDEVKLAKSFCRTCPVEDDCLEFALAYGENDGIWGGTTGPERRVILRRRRLAR